LGRPENIVYGAPAQLRGFLGVGMKEAQASRSGGGTTGLACLGASLAPTSVLFRVHLLAFLHS